MKRLDAIYENGTFRPLDRPGLADGQQVCLVIETAEEATQKELMDMTYELCRGEAHGPTWLLPMIETFMELLQLSPDWDSYGANRVRPECITFALREVLPSIMRTSMPMPVAVPTSKGGIQLEWHVRGVDLEIEITPTKEILAYYEDQRDGTEWEGEVTSSIAPLEGPISRLSNPECAKGSLDA